MMSILRKATYVIDLPEQSILLIYTLQLQIGKWYEKSLKWQIYF
jgi:hypothetical protein